MQEMVLLGLRCRFENSGRKGLMFVPVPVAWLLADLIDDNHNPWNVIQLSYMATSLYWI